MDAELTAALIGAGAAALFVYCYESYKERRDRGRIASTLLVEMVAQAEFINVLSKAAHKNDVLAVQENFVRFLPPRPTMFEALAHQIALLGAQPSSCIVACYGSLSWARSLVESLPTTIEFASVKRGPHNAPTMPEYISAEYTAKLIEQQSKGILERLRQACRGAAFNAILAIRELDRIAPYDRLPNDETVIADTVRKLEGAANPTREDAIDSATAA